MEIYCFILNRHHDIINHVHARKFLEILLNMLYTVTYEGSYMRNFINPLKITVLLLELIGLFKNLFPSLKT